MDIQEIVILAAALSFASKHPQSVLGEAETAKMVQPPGYAVPVNPEDLNAVATVCREHSNALHSLLLDGDMADAMRAHNVRAMELRRQDVARN